MSKQFQMIMPEEIREQFLRECGYYDEEAPGFIDNKKYANLCATWGANQEYQESYNFIDDARGSDHARVYQESRRPKIQTEKEKALEALDYIDEMAIDNMKNYTCIDKLKEHRNFLYKLIESMPDEDT